MRTSYLLLCVALAAAADATPPPAAPPATQKLVDASAEAVQKAHEVYLQALRKEQDKLVAALQKEQDKATKKGDLETALAIKAQIDDVQAGLLQRQAEAGKDLLGNPTMASPPSGVAAGLSTDCAVAPDSTPYANPPKELEAVLARCSHITIAKGDRTHYTFACTNAGTVLVSTGGSSHNFAEVWAELQKAGFKRVEENGGREVWWSLDLRSGQRFTTFDALPAVMPVTVYANRFVHPH